MKQKNDAPNHTFMKTTALCQSEALSVIQGSRKTASFDDGSGDSPYLAGTLCRWDVNMSNTIMIDYDFADGDTFVDHHIRMLIWVIVLINFGYRLSLVYHSKYVDDTHIEFRGRGQANRTLPSYGFSLIFNTTSVAGSNSQGFKIQHTCRHSSYYSI